MSTQCGNSSPRTKYSKRKVTQKLNLKMKRFENLKMSDLIFELRNFQILRLLFALHVFFNLVHEHRIDSFFHGR
jgi:hypothetical protein